MGAHTFGSAIWTDADLRTAYNRAVADAAHEYGESGYNGTISTTYGITEAMRGETMTMTENAATFIANAVFSDMAPRELSVGKWGNAKGLKIASDEAFTFTTKTLTADLSDVHAYQREQFDREDVHITDWVARDFAAYLASKTFALGTIHTVAVDFAPKVKMVTTRPEGAPATRYEVVNENHAVRTFDTRPAANAFIRKEMESSTSRYTALAVRAVKTLSTTKRVVVAAKVKVTVTLATPRARRPKDTRNGWFMYGVAAE